MTERDTQWPPGGSPEVFFQNLEALSEAQPDLAERLCWPVGGDHVTCDEAGSVTYRVHLSQFPLALGAEEVRALLDEARGATGTAGVPRERPLCVLGVGLGELVVAALERGHPVVAWDRDPWLLRLLLSTRDHADALRSGRLQLALGADLVALADASGPRVAHPFLAKLYAHELAFLEALRESPSDAEPKRALLCDGGLYVASLARALVARGYGVWTFDADRLSVEELRETARTISPELVAAVNHRDGLAEFAAEIGARLVVWEIDPATGPPRTAECSTEHVRVFTYRREHVRGFESAGFEHVEYLPLAADTELRRPLLLDGAEHERFASPVSFVGSSMVANAVDLGRLFVELLARWGAASGCAPGSVLEDVLAAQRADLARWIVPELLEARAPGLREWCRATGEPHDPTVLLGEVAASEKRLSWATELGSLGLEVWGDPGWERVAGTVRYRGAASHAGDLSRIYCASTVNLDIGRLYQSDIVTMRVYDVLACGGFALVEHSAALEEVFEVGSELESYRDLPELRAKLEHYLAHPQQARAIAERGQRAVLERHSFEGRVAHMLGSFPRVPTASHLGLQVLG